MQDVKAISIQYVASDELSSLFEDFRLMCNDAIRAALKYEEEHDGERVKSRFRLIELAYPRLKEYGLHTHYILSACEVAYSAYRDKNRESAPYVRKAFLKLDKQSYLLDHLILRIPTRPRRFIYLTLHASDYHLSLIDCVALKKGSVTINGHSVSIAPSKEAVKIEPSGQVGIDVNERNVTWSDSSGRIEKVDTSEVAELKECYRAVMGNIAEKTQKDRRVQQLLLSKYGKREKDRTIQRTYGVTKKIVEHAQANQFGNVMEKLKGIRKLYRKGNGQGKSYRGRMNSWMFREFQGR